LWQTLASLDDHIEPRFKVKRTLALGQLLLLSLTPQVPRLTPVATTGWRVERPLSDSCCRTIAIAGEVVFQPSSNGSLTRDDALLDAVVQDLFEPASG
jgi:hypothetical protein